MSKARELRKQQDQQLQRARDARDKGFDRTADRALAAAAELGRKAAAQEADGTGAWSTQAHP